MAAKPIAVLLMAYGGPNNLDDVEPYLMDVRGGRPTRPELVAEIRERYALIGGKSPLKELTEAQAKGLGSALGPGFRTYVGMRHWHPYIKETVDRVAREGLTRILGIVMAPHFSEMSVGAYEKKLLDATEGRIETLIVRRWGDHPKFIAAVTMRVRQALTQFRPDEKVQVVFTAHSLPERILKNGDPYPDELKQSAAAVANSVGLKEWHFAFQSAGATPEPWLGPEAGETMKQLAGAGHRAFLVVPIGFVCDHVEILYDVDVVYQGLARELGVHLERTVSLNADPSLIAVLEDLVRTSVAERGWVQA
ncbi:MAG TPA: ferrochelatase [Gemmatimonadales bacterium]|nr:ferrochelatase [Gemmatimonadales bacterium]